MKRANLYLALTRWAAFRREALTTDEADGNVEFAGLLFMVDGCEDCGLVLGHRLGMLTVEESERLVTEVTSLIQSETGDEVVTEPETQPTK
jgi:hypothetical protein